MRHRGHYAPLRETQFLGERRQGIGQHHQEGVLHRLHWSSRPRSGGHSKGCHRQHLQIRVSERNFDAQLQPRRQRPQRADQESGATAPRCEASDDLLGRRRDLERRFGGVDRAGASPRRAGHQHVDGPGRLSRDRFALSRNARHARHLRGESGDARLRRVARCRCAIR